MSKPVNAPLIGETGMLEDVVEIAERALRDPAQVNANEMQSLASAVVAHVRRVRMPDDEKTGT